MRVGVLILPEDRWSSGVEKWRRAEQLGFEHAWTYDHLAWRDLRDSSWFASIPVLTAAAAVTTSIRLGTLVASPSFRHPVPFARELITLDDIAGGRLTLGIGAGAQGWDTTVLGHEPWTPAERTARFAEFVDLLDRLLRDSETSFTGRYWSADGARNHPGCVQQPRIPFAIGATAPRSMRVLARYGSVWVTSGDRSYEGPPLGPDQGAAMVARQATLFEEACEAEGRDPATFDRLVLTGPRFDAGLRSPAAFGEVKEAYAAVGTTDLVIPWPRPTEPYAADESILDHITG